MAFIADPGTFIRLPAAPSSVWLWCMNRLIDFGFFVDLLLAFNTAYFDEASGHWVTDRYVIARSYLQAWFWLDLVSLVPYSVLPVSEKAGLLRFVKLARLMRLLRAFKSPRILANLYKHITLHNRTQTLVKYITLLIVTIHWSACCLRLATSIHLDKCGEHHDKCPATVLTASTGLHARELTNTLTNLDPVGNEFKLTFDSLNDYMTKKNFPIALRLRLREYIMLAEPVYRDNYYRALLEKLSPRLEAIVAHQNLGNVVNRIPFFAYTVQRAYGVNTGSLVALKPSRDVTDADAGAAGDVRLAHVVNVPTYLKYDVEYVDDASVETGVSRRVVVDRNDVLLRTKIQQTLYQRDHFVIAVARLLEPQLVMHSDIIVYRNLSLNDVMYIVETGYIVLFGADPSRSERVLVRKSNDSFGDDIAMNVGGKEPVLRQFTAKAKRKTRLFTLGSGRFNALLEGPTFSIFRTYISLYGRWMRIRMVLFRGLKSGQNTHVESTLNHPFPGAAPAHGAPEPRRARDARGLEHDVEHVEHAAAAAAARGAYRGGAARRRAPAPRGGDGGELLAAFGAGTPRTSSTRSRAASARPSPRPRPTGARATQLRTLCEAVCRGLVDLAFSGGAAGRRAVGVGPRGAAPGRTPVPAAGDDGYDRDDDDDDLRYRPAGDRAGKECEIPNFKGSFLGRFPLVSADFGRAIISRNGLEA
ncbi:phosphorelay sensor kinase [Aureococcus anophagefferens]|nr:phosphorelay sensor kinase [Aureococcus anophagefferens]